MKKHNADKTSQKYPAGHTFYNFKNNDFRKTNVYLNHLDQFRTSPDDITLEDEAYSKLLRNNQEISGNLNAIKFSKKFNPSITARNFSSPVLLPIDLAKVKGACSPNDLVSEPSNRNTSYKRKLILNTPTKYIINSQPGSCGVSPISHINSARVSTALKPPSEILKSPKSLLDMSPEEVQILEKQLLAKTKLDRDRNQVLNVLTFRGDAKRDVSYISETHTKSLFMPKPSHPSTMGNLQPLSARNREQQAATASILNVTPEPVKTAATTRTNVEKTHGGLSVSAKKNTPDLTLLEEGRSGVLDLEKRRTNTALGIKKKASLDYSPVPQLNLGVIPSLSTLQGSPLNDYIAKTCDAGFEKIGALKLYESSQKKLLKFDANEVKKIESDELVTELKKDLPNVFSSVPASRQDVIVLSSWMDTKMKELLENTAMKEDEKSVQSDKIYNICMNEILRQVSLDCAERGELLYRIWISYFQMFTQRKTSLEEEIKRIKTQGQEENQKQYEWSQKFITKRDQEIEDYKTQVQKLLKEQEENNKTMDKLQNQNIKYKKKIDQLRGLVNVLRTEVQEVKDENCRYAKKLAFKIANTTKGTYVPTFLAHNNGAKEGAREASVLENLGLKHNFSNTPRKPRPSATPREPDTGSNVPSLRIGDADKASSGTESRESSLDFVYEDPTTQTKHVFRLDQLNNNILAYKNPNADPNSVDVIRIVTVQSSAKETQTDLQLIGEKYDVALNTQKIFDELLTEIKLKREVDVLAEVDLLRSIDMFKKVVVPPKQRYSTFSPTNVESPVEREINIRPDFARDMKRKFLSGTAKSEPSTMNELAADKNEGNGLEKIMEAESEEPASATKRPSKLKIDEDGKVQKVRRHSLKITSPSGKNSFLFGFEPIQEANEEGKSFVKSNSKLGQDEAKASGSENSSPFEGVFGLTLGQQPVETPGKNVETKSGEGNSANAQTSFAKDASYLTEDLFHSLNDVISELEEGKQSHLGEEESAEDNTSKRLRGQSAESSFDFKNNNNNEILDNEGRFKKRLTISSIANSKIFASHMASSFRTKDDTGGIMDKARLMTIIRMYKVEKEKNKSLQSSIVELEEQIINEKQNQAKLNENIDEMKVHIKMLEKLKATCPHGKCHLCRGEKEPDFEEIDSSKQNIEGTNSEVRVVTETDDLQERPEEEDEREGEIEGGEGEGELETDERGESGFERAETEEAGVVDTEPDASPSGRVQRQGSNRQEKFRKKKRTLVSIQPEFGKKKAVNQNQIYSLATAIINKIKDKKYGQFRNFMPIKSVLKQITTLYNDRISQTKENMVLKEEEFFFFAYKWFHNNFGFRKIAEQKYIIFILSVKKYLHVVRINLFARFMGLLQGSSNFSVDELNRYLEGLEYIANSTLGTPIVNNETDSKHYAPFLRGLEYLRYFSENKLATEEYIEFKREFDAIKEVDPKNINRNGIVDIDLFMTKVLMKYRIICNRTKQFVVNAFKAADLDANKYCSLREFIMIYRNIDPDRFEQGFAENLFYEHADIKLQGEINLSFDKFTVVCVEYGLFTDLQQDQFLGIQHAQEIEDKMQRLKIQWSLYYLEIDEKLSAASKITKVERDYWYSILKILNERLTNFDKIDPNDYKPILIAFKILDQEVERLMENEAERDMYGIKIHKTDSKQEKQDK